MRSPVRAARRRGLVLSASNISRNRVVSEGEKIGGHVPGKKCPSCSLCAESVADDRMRFSAWGYQ